MELIEKINKILSNISIGNHQEINGDLDEIERDESLKQIVQNIKRLNEDLTNLNNQYSEQKRIYETLLNNLPGAVYRCSNEIDWPMYFISEGVKDFTGYTAQEFLSGEIKYADLITEDFQESVWNDVQKSIQERLPFRIIYSLRSKDGKLMWIWEQGVPIFEKDFQVKFIEGFMTDITDRINTEKYAESMNKELNTLNQATVIRETAMFELKKELRDLKKALEIKKVE